MARWIRMPGTLTCISAGGAGLLPAAGGASTVGALQMIWGVNREATVFARDFCGPAGDEWRSVPGSLVEVSASRTPDRSGTCPVWGINAQNQVFRLKTSQSGVSWEGIPGALATISVGGCGVFGINPAGNVFEYVDDGRGAGKWVGHSGSLRRIAVGDEDIWGANGGGQVFRGVRGSSGVQWSAIPGSVAEICVAGGLVCGINAAGQFFYTLDAITWSELTDGEARTFVKCSTNGQTVWSLDASGGVWLWGEQ